mmetsp:Transcript_132391/g.423689  ORF Transcript_132391/g.423689 Transcript_132391/m.423689 type:complete len:255 (+) Transcript_132391:99-863(+)
MSSSNSSAASQCLGSLVPKSAQTLNKLLLPVKAASLGLSSDPSAPLPVDGAVVRESLMMLSTSRPTLCSRRPPSVPTSRGMRTLCLEDSHVFHMQPWSSVTRYKVCPRGTASPMGMPKHFKHKPIVLPKISKKHTTSNNVPLISSTFVPAPSVSSTHEPISRTKDIETTPRSPECQIMSMYRQEINNCLSFGNLRATTDLIPFANRESGTTAITRATIQNPTIKRANLAPLVSPVECCPTTETATMPVSKKIDF